MARDAQNSGREVEAPASRAASLLSVCAIRHPQSAIHSRKRRRRLLVNPRLQLRYVGVIVAIQALAMAVMAWAVFAVVWSADGGLLDQVQWSTPAAQVLAGTIRRATITTLALSVGFGVVCAAAGLLISRGVAGPIARITEAVRLAAQDGDPRAAAHRVRLRRGDGLLDLADEFNALLARLEERQHQQRELLARVSGLVSTITETLQRGDPVTDDVLEQTQELEGLMLRAATRTAAE